MGLFDAALARPQSLYSPDAPIIIALDGIAPGATLVPGNNMPGRSEPYVAAALKRAWGNTADVRTVPWDGQLRDNAQLQNYIALTEETISALTKPPSNRPVVVVAHSWGSVVAYKALADLQHRGPARRIAVLVTLGSPLRSPCVKSAILHHQIFSDVGYDVFSWPGMETVLGDILIKPSSIQYWVNFWKKTDGVSYHIDAADKNIPSDPVGAPNGLLSCFWKDFFSDGHMDYLTDSALAGVAEEIRMRLSQSGANLARTGADGSRTNATPPPAATATEEKAVAYPPTLHDATGRPKRTRTLCFVPNVIRGRATVGSRGAPAIVMWSTAEPCPLEADRRRKEAEALGSSPPRDDPLPFRSPLREFTFSEIRVRARLSIGLYDQGPGLDQRGCSLTVEMRNEGRLIRHGHLSFEAVGTHESAIAATEIPVIDLKPQKSNVLVYRWRGPTGPVTCDNIKSFDLVPRRSEIAAGPQFGNTTQARDEHGRTIEELVRHGAPAATAFSASMTAYDGAMAAGNYDVAFRLAQDLANQDYPPGQHALGILYENGQGVAKDPMQAVAWYRKAAEQGYAPAQMSLGNAYVNGFGVQRDYAQAGLWYREAAGQGHAAAQAGLGFLYSSGQGVPQDDAQALAWFRKAAEQGDPNGQAWLGVMYAQGRGAARDVVTARFWLKKAAAQGDRTAAAWLKYVSKRN